MRRFFSHELYYKFKNENEDVVEVAGTGVTVPKGEGALLLQKKSMFGPTNLPDRDKVMKAWEVRTAPRAFGLTLSPPVRNESAALSGDIPGCLTLNGVFVASTLGQVGGHSGTRGQVMESSDAAFEFDDNGKVKMFNLKELQDNPYVVVTGPLVDIRLIGKSDSVRSHEDLHDMVRVTFLDDRTVEQWQDLGVPVEKVAAAGARPYTEAKVTKQFGRWVSVQ